MVSDTQTPEVPASLLPRIRHEISLERLLDEVTADADTGEATSMDRRDDTCSTGAVACDDDDTPAALTGRTRIPK